MVNRVRLLMPEQQSEVNSSFFILSVWYGGCLLPVGLICWYGEIFFGSFL